MDQTVEKRSGRHHGSPASHPLAALQLHSRYRAVLDAQGGRVIEAYPTVPRNGKLPPVSSFMGFPEIFARAGFVECARPSDARMIMRHFME